MYIKCEYFFFIVNIVKQKTRGFYKIKFCWRQIFEIRIIYKPSFGTCDVPQKMWARSVQPFRRLLDINKHPDKLSMIDEIFSNLVLSEFVRTEMFKLLIFCIVTEDIVLFESDGVQ